MAMTPASSKAPSFSGGGPDTLTLGLAEDAYLGDAQFTVMRQGACWLTDTSYLLAFFLDLAVGQSRRYCVAGQAAKGRPGGGLSYLPALPGSEFLNNR